MSAHKISQRPTVKDLFQTLAQQRSMLSLIDRDILAASGNFAFEKSQWVRLWCDLEHAVTSDCGFMTAYRAITVDGKLLWYVFRDASENGFHSTASDPHAAMEHAMQCWTRRDQIRARWSDIEQIASDLRKGQLKFEVRVSDAHASPLCSLGIEGFMAAVGLNGFSRISGRMAGMLMKVEPHMGFVIYEAWLRTQNETLKVPAMSRAVQSGFEVIS